MATQRLLIRIVVVSTIVCVFASPIQGQNTTREPPPIPRWVRLGMMSDGVMKWASLTKRTIDNASSDSPLQTAVNVGDLMIATRSLYRENAKLLAGRRIGTMRPNLRFAVLDGVITVYDLANGNRSAADAGRQAVVSGACIVAGSLTAAGMIWFAGTVGTASTGIAIASLSGAAYTSAATAYWGGGAIAAGGGGMAVGSAIISGGVVIAVVVVAYSVHKLWDMADPSQRDALNMLADGLGKRADLTDASTPYGAALVAETHRLEEVTRRAAKR